jgi:deoxyadenosine/deoxycytidine kinase
MAKAKKIKHVAVAGNIGAGKTTLTELLSKHYRWIPQFEDVDQNPYLMDFYDDMPRWSFNLQIYFLNSRLNQLLEIHHGTETIIQDRTIFEDANIFAKCSCGWNGNKTRYCDLLPGDYEWLQVR